MIKLSGLSTCLLYSLNYFNSVVCRRTCTMTGLYHCVTSKQGCTMFHNRDIILGAHMDKKHAHNYAHYFYKVKYLHPNSSVNYQLDLLHYQTWEYCSVLFSIVQYYM